MPIQKCDSFLRQQSCTQSHPFGAGSRFRKVEEDEDFNHTSEIGYAFHGACAEIVEWMGNR